MEWSREEIRLLKQGVARYPSSFSADKNHRWKYISKVVGSRGKKECYSKYKELIKSKGSDVIPNQLSSSSLRKDSSKASKVRRSENEKYSYASKKLDRTKGKWNNDYEYSLDEYHDRTPTKHQDREHRGRESTSQREISLKNLMQKYEDKVDKNLSRLLQESLQTEPTYNSAIFQTVETSGSRNTSRLYEEKYVENHVSESKFQKTYKPQVISASSQNNRLHATIFERSKDVKSPELELEDCDDFDLEDEMEETFICSRSKNHNHKGGQAVVNNMNVNIHKIEISLEQAKSIRGLLFGKKRTEKVLPSSWMNQGFCFNTKKDLQYGLVQHEGGPCGIIAVVQAFFLKYLIFDLKVSNWQNPPPRERCRALVLALTEIIWNAGDGKRAVVAVYSSTARGSASHRSAGYKPDGTTDKMVLHRVNSRNATENTVSNVINLFNAERGPGVMMLLCSCILSRRNLESDFDVGLGESATLIGTHNYASQELVNLLLVGRAFSNVFDGTQELKAENPKEKSLKLRGVPKRGSIGFLTLFEHYQYMQVGKFYKNPHYPIWVVCSESHYSILFSTEETLVEERTEQKISSQTFDLFYYDELGRQKETYRLTVNPDPIRRVKHSTDKDLISPLEHCIRTRWPGATVDWNDSEPLL